MTDVWSFYLKTVVEVWLEDGGVLTVKQVPDVGGDEWPFGEADGVVWIITACNPRSEPLTDDENQARHRALGEELAASGYPYLESVGFDPDDRSWSEIGYAVLGMSEEEVFALARSWDQNAIYRWTPTAWETLGVLLKGYSVSGWRRAEQPEQ